MGGHAAGEVASLLAVACLRDLLPELTNEKFIIDGICATHLALHEAVRRNLGLSGMGTTVAGLRLLGSEAICLNVGDSKIYVADARGLTQLSEDHVVKGHILTQCLGGGGLAHLKPAVRRVPLSQGSRFLLCTDGLTDLVADDRIIAHLWSPDPANSLIDAALAAGGVDNVTAVVLEIAKPPHP